MHMLIAGHLVDSLADTLELCRVAWLSLIYILMQHFLHMQVKTEKKGTVCIL